MATFRPWLTGSKQLGKATKRRLKQLGGIRCVLFSLEKPEVSLHPYPQRISGHLLGLSHQWENDETSFGIYNQTKALFLGGAID